MLEPWNDKSVSQPPINTLPWKINFNLDDLKSYCSTIIYVLSKQSTLHKESAILSRFLYKFDKKFRNDIGYRNFKKVNTALRKYLSLNIAKDIQCFIDLLPENNELESYLPTRQLLEYILVRLMTFSKLMYRTTVCSKNAAIFYLDRIKRGQSHWMSLMPYALLSKVWSIVLSLLEHSCIWYKQLYPFLNELPYKGLHFLPEGYKLPIDLEEWIDMKHLIQSGPFKWYQKYTKSDMNVDSIKVEDNESNLSENILKYVNKINNETENCDEGEKQSSLSNQEVHIKHVSNKYYDEGVVISRESFTQLTLPTNLTSSLDCKMGEEHKIKNVVDRDTLIKFIENEEELRYESNNMSLTKHLSFMQWHALKTAMLKLDKSINKLKLEKKVNKIWQQKCLEYL